MGTFVLIEPDAFSQQNKEDKEMAQGIGGQSLETRRAQLGTFHHVRRPVRGIQVKDETYATIQVRKANGTSIRLFDAADPSNTGTGIRNSNFLIQSISEQRAEKQQVILTFGEPYIFFFGEQPRMISVSGILLNTEDFNWRAEWWENYDQYLRGTQCVRQNTRLYLSWDDIIVEGYITQANAMEDSNNRNLVQFNFQMFLTNYQNISRIGEGADRAHIQGKEINLDPSEMDLPGNSNSTTLFVRLQNVQQQEISDGQGSASLLDFLRKGQVQSAATRLVELQGQVVDFLSLAGQFVSGRNIRVPRGYEGAAAFDQDVQVALASVPGAPEIINGERVVKLQAIGNNGLVPNFVANLGSKFTGAHYGPLSDNLDEFVAKQSLDGFSKTQLGDYLFPEQLADDQQAMQHVADVFEKYGIDVDPPDDLKRFFRKTMFGIVSVAAGANLNNSSKLRSDRKSVV